MKIDHLRWPPGAVAKSSINTKMTMSQEPLVETDPTLCQNVSCMKPNLNFLMELLNFMQIDYPRSMATMGR